MASHFCACQLIWTLSPVLSTNQFPPPTSQTRLIPPQYSCYIILMLLLLLLLCLLLPLLLLYPLLLEFAVPLVLSPQGRHRPP